MNEVIGTIPTITIFLTPPDAELFKSYQQFHATFALLVKSGAFDIKSGAFVCHLDEYGTVKLIERNDTLYNARLEKKLSTS